MHKTIYITLNNNNNYLVILDNLSLNVFVAKTYAFITSIDDLFPYHFSIPVNDDIWRVEKDNQMLEEEELAIFLKEYNELIENMKEVIGRLK